MPAQDRIWSCDRKWTGLRARRAALEFRRHPLHNPFGRHAPLVVAAQVHPQGDSRAIDVELDATDADPLATADAWAAFTPATEQMILVRATGQDARENLGLNQRAKL